MKSLQTLCCFTVPHVWLKPDGTFSTLLYGQIIWNNKALMMQRREGKKEGKKYSG